MLRKYLGEIKRHKHLYLWLLCWLWPLVSLAQDPVHFTYDDETDLPSNEVYSIAQDPRGFIWIGCDAGLYKFDGVRYIGYKCVTQKSKSVTGLTFSTSGKLYCHNFQSQIFVLDNDTLRELMHGYAKIPNIACDKTGNLWVNDQIGLAVYNEAQKQWKNYENIGVNSVFTDKEFTKSIKITAANEKYFLGTAGVGVIRENKLRFIKSEVLEKEGIGSFLVEVIDKKIYLLSIKNNKMYVYDGEGFKEFKNEKFRNAVGLKKVTNIKALPDGNLWICTYNGIICYNQRTDNVSLYYPNFAFSDCLIDREGNYWFTTLQSGLIRVPNFKYLVWNKLENNKIIKIETDTNHVYFTTINGNIGQINTQTNQLNTFYTGRNEDIQSLNYITEDKCLYFFTNNTLYGLKNNKITVVLEKTPPIKYVQKINNIYLVCTSFGAFFYDFLAKKKLSMITPHWSREMAYDSVNKTVWLATNQGLFGLRWQNDTWQMCDSLLVQKQIVSVSFSQETGQLFVLAFDGKIYQLTDLRQLELVGSLPSNAQPYRIQAHKQKLYITTNKGLWTLDMAQRQLKAIDLHEGLASDNVQDLVILGKNAWLATGKGLQKILLTEHQTIAKAKIYLKNKDFNYSGIQLQYGQGLVLQPEASHYYSNGKFEYAYRIRNANAEWNKLPASVSEINIQNIPIGNFEIELKAIDYWGKDSENIITISGYVHPPFWKTWQFMVFVLLCFLLLVYWIFRRQLAKRQKELKQQNELNISKLTAIQSQMNPHFIFNSLNSIQDLVLKGDVENSYSYLTTFSNLVRKTLQFSDKDFIDFEQEIKLLEIYLSLEKLRFKKDFNYSIDTHEIEDILIPPLLVQPFIENALIHGLLHKTGAKTLKIRFSLAENLVCVIEDNGIGRENAKAIRARQRAEHESFSGKAIGKRFEILSELFAEDLGYEYEDLMENGQPVGTRVVLRIPFRHKF
ncbi:Two component regulator propeller [Flexibacter flexilis DSM 6793]|uniref:Two component regulator propeller n=2 Tax=Flexibacter flexilis TaxID=998 RepID=A0A1I1FBC3_9BACT|nr:Two component regulator propeller [Flexibacter flexilis DSM 6793]